MGYRAYLQSYASYQLKKIFDVNALDLNKVAKSFGFKVAPRVNLMVGPGNGQSTRVGEKRRREADEDDEVFEEMIVDGVDEDDENVEKKDVSVRGKDGRTKRMEVLGKKSVDKEMYRKSRDFKAMGKNWSR